MMCLSWTFSTLTTIFSSTDFSLYSLPQISIYIPFHRFKSLEGISGTVLLRFESYLTGKTWTVPFSNQNSRPADVFFCVPRGSGLDPSLFIFYPAPRSSNWNSFFCGGQTATSLLSWSDTLHYPRHASLTWRLGWHQTNQNRMRTRHTLTV